MQAVGIIQEQHPERTQLFNQWKQLPMDLLVDPLNALDVAAVPIVLLVDAGGTIRYRNPTPQQLKDFLETEYGPATKPAAMPMGQAWASGDELVLAGRLDEGIAFYRDALTHGPDDGRLLFRLGVALRMRFDSGSGQDSDFTEAVRAWRAARRQDPNQYIWRRRIQQYGPVLDKPYPFYDWVEQARQEIRDRGEQPLRLSIEPTGAELASPGRAAAESVVSEEGLDPEGRLQRDKAEMVRIESIVVPSTEADQRTARIHLLLTPRVAAGFAWNNEAEPLRIWIDGPRDVRLGRQLLEVANAAQATSQERRAVEFELSWSGDADPAAQPLSGYAVYNVCDKRSGQCMIRRQDFVVRWMPGG